MMKPLRNSPALPFLALVASLSAVRHVEAQPRNPAAAEKLFNEGLEWEDKGDWEKACPLYAASNKSEPSAGAQMNVGRCAEHFGRIATAWAEFKKTRVLNRETQGDVRKAQVEKFLDEADARLGPKLPYALIDVRGRPPGLRVTDNGAELPIESLGKSLPLDPGKHEIVATAPDFLEERRTLEVVEAGKAELVIELRAAPPKKAVDPVKPTLVADDGLSPQVGAGIGIGAGAVLCLIGAAITGGLAGAERGKLDDLVEEGRCSEDPDTNQMSCGDVADVTIAEDASSLGQALATTSSVMLYSGLGLGVVAVIVTVTAPGFGGGRSEPAPARAISLSPVLSPTTQGLLVQGRF